MKLSGNIILTFLLLIIICSLYRIMPGRPLGFAPQWAMGIFAGSIIKDKKLAFLLPILSMFLSDALYELLFRTGVGTMPGFYDGQITNYILFGSMTIFGFLISKISMSKIILASIAAPATYFILSNTLVWLGGGGLERPKTFQGLIMTFVDGLPFLGWSIVSTILFSGVFFGIYAWLKKPAQETNTQIA